MRCVEYNLVWLCAFLACACVDDDGQRPEPDSQNAPALSDVCREHAAMNTELIADFELGIATGFWVSSDGTAPMSQLAGREPSATGIDGGRCGVSRYALCITASGLSQYGGALGVNFRGGPVDASDFDGIVLFARRGANSNRSLFFALSDRYTDENGGAALLPDNEPSCLEETDDESRKCDRFGVGIGMETTWRMYRVSFDEMKQRGYGMPSPEDTGVDRTAIIGINISFDVGDWDFCIDDLAFYREES